MLASQAVVNIQSADKALSVEQESMSQGFFAYSLRTTLQQLSIFFLVIQGVFGGIGTIALVVAVFDIANSVMMSILEGTRETGFMKAVGATNHEVMSVFLAEARTMGLLGGLDSIL